MKAGRFCILETPLVGLNVLVRQPIGDDRGFLERMYCDEDLKEYLPGRSILQINRTFTVRSGSIRGLHFQRPPHAETKLVSCMQGQVFDVAVDIRKDSPTFLHWHGEVLSAENHRTLMIPEGFAHGFQTLTADCIMLYLHTAQFCPAAESGLHCKDPAIGIKWPLPIEGLSERDTAHPSAAEFAGVIL